MNLEELLKKQVTLKSIANGEPVQITPDFRVAVQPNTTESQAAKEGVRIIIHPHGYDGETLDFLVIGNELHPI